MGYKHGIKTVRSTLGYLAMEDDLIKRMEMAHGEIRAMGTGSKSSDTSKKNQKRIDKFDQDFTALKEKPADPRELEILAERLVDICTDIIEDNTKSR